MNRQAIDNLAPVVLLHDTQWAIEPNAARQLWRMLEATNAQKHREEFESRGGMSVDGADSYLVADGIAYIGISGPMTKAPTSLSGGTSTVRVRRQIRHAASENSVRAIVLQIDSPGGSVSGTEALADDVAAAAKKKTVCAYIEDCCCSAAYWVASQCTHVYANPTAIVGSIGTYMVVADLSRMAENMGIRVHCLSTGKYKGAGVEGTAVTDEHLADWQRIVDDLNAHFLAAVAKGRRMDAGRVANLADGRVHIGADAKKLGLVDGLASLDSVVASMQKALKPAAKAENDFPCEDEPPAGDSFEEALDSALAAVTGVADRLREVHSLRVKDGRRVSVSRLAQAHEVHEALGQVLDECAVGGHDDENGAADGDTVPNKKLRDDLLRAALGATG